MSNFINYEAILQREQMLNNQKPTPIRSDGRELFFQRNGAKYFKFNESVSFLYQQSQNPVTASHTLNLYETFMSCGNEDYEKQAITEQFKKYIIPSVKSTENIPTIVREAFQEEIKDVESMDRILRNQQTLLKRFKLESCITTTDNLEDAVNEFCLLVDTYQYPLYAKINIALENFLITSAKFKSIDSEEKSTIVETVMDYFLSSERVLSDFDLKMIQKALNNNALYTKEETSCENFLYNTYSITETINNSIENYPAMLPDQVRKLTKKLKTATKITEELVGEVFDAIYNFYVIANVISFAIVVCIISLLFAIAIIAPKMPSKIFHTIREGWFGLYNRAKQSTDSNIVARAKAVDDQVTALVSTGSIKECTEIIIDNINGNGKLIQKSSSYKVMKENALLESKDYANSEDVESLIHSYKAAQKKDEKLLSSIIRKIYMHSPEQIIDETPKVLQLIRRFGVLATFSLHPIFGALYFAVDKCIEISIKRKETESLLKYFKREQELVEKKLEKLTIDSDTYNRYNDYSKCLDKCIEKIQDYRDNLYTDKELEQMEMEEASYSNEISDNDNIEDVVIHFANDAIERLKQALKTFWKTSSLNIEYNYAEKCDDFYMKYVSPNGVISYVIAIINIGDDQSASIVDGIYEAVSKCNATIPSNGFISVDTSDYLNGAMTNRILITYQYKLRISNPYADNSVLEPALDEMVNVILCNGITEDFTENFIEISSIGKRLKSVMESLVKTDDLDAVMSVINACPINNDLVKESLFSIYNYEDNITQGRINVAMKELNSNAHSILEAYCATHVVYELIQEASQNKKEKHGMVQKATNTATEKMSISKSLNSTCNKIGLSVEAMKKDAQNLSTKEKEISKNIDVSTSYLKKSIEKALTTNRREAIIKGSIIPSFSKTIKLALGVGAIGLVTNPAIACITAIGALACSKALTERERQLLLDEIIVEQKVIDREIQNAENSNNTKKLRELLLYQKKLKREEQRIRYNLKLYGKYAPSDDDND